MRAFASGDRLEPSAQLCMECGVCEMYACPMGLNPRRVQQMQRAALRSSGQKTEFSLKSPPELASYRQVPSGRLMALSEADGYLMDVDEYEN